MKDCIARIGPLLREFPDGFEARVVNEQRAGKQHWIFLRPFSWVESELAQHGITPVAAQSAATKRARARVQRPKP